MFASHIRELDSKYPMNVFQPNYSNQIRDQLHSLVTPAESQKLNTPPPFSLPPNTQTCSHIIITKMT